MSGSARASRADKRRHRRRELYSRFRYQRSTLDPRLSSAMDGQAREGSGRVSGSERIIGAHELGYALELVGRVSGRQHQLPFYRVDEKRERRNERATP